MQRPHFWAGILSIAALVAALPPCGASAHTVSVPPTGAKNALNSVDASWQCRPIPNSTSVQPFVLVGSRTLGAVWQKLSGPIVIPSNGAWHTLDAVFYLTSNVDGTGYIAVAIESDRTAWIGQGYDRPGWDLSVRDGSPSHHSLSLSIRMVKTYGRELSMSLSSNDAAWRGSVAYRCLEIPNYHYTDFDVEPNPSSSPKVL